MVNVSVSELFYVQRFTGTPAQWLVLILYSPIGVVLAIFRIFMLIHIFFISCLLPMTMQPLRSIRRFMLSLSGLIVSVENYELKDDNSKLLVCNYLSTVDRLAVEQLQPTIMANEWGYPPLLTWVFGLQDVSADNDRETFLTKVRKVCQDSRTPLYTRPEGTSTSGQGLLKFSTWQFSVCDELQPVTIRASRPLPLSLTLLDSSVLADLFIFIFCPYTHFIVRYHPTMSRPADSSPEQFAEDVRQVMAESLGVEATNYSRHDKKELVKKFLKDPVQATGQSEPVRVRRNSPRSQPLSPELEALVLSCKAVVPQVPIDVLRKEIQRTKDLDVTLSNILECNIQYEPEEGHSSASISPPASARESSKPIFNSVERSPSGNSTYAADNFSKKSDLRHLSLAERKALMLREARLRYIQKHNLAITLKQIESGKF